MRVVKPSPGPQPPRYGLAGVREETQQRVEAEAALVGGCDVKPSDLWSVSGRVAAQQDFLVRGAKIQLWHREFR
ncbi:hypothetical protein ACWD04_31820 [Streptomyces sp. NPDC002911]